MLAALPDAVKPVAEVAYITGWRIRSELLTRQWMHVDFEPGWIRVWMARRECLSKPFRLHSLTRPSRETASSRWPLLI